MLYASVRGRSGGRDDLPLYSSVARGGLEARSVTGLLPSWGEFLAEVRR